MKTTLIAPLCAGLLMLGALGCTEKDPEVVVTSLPVSDKDWSFEDTPVWSEEFNTPGKPDPTKWTYDVGAGGWGNNEKQYYSQGDNVDIADGICTITARREAREGAQYTSTRMVTRGLADFTYGRFEARIQVPAGRGTWPAFWMLPTDRVYGDWPKSGEIDIMEHVGYDANNFHFSTHCEAYYFKQGNQKTSALKVPSGTTDLHLYRMDWTPYSIRGFIDDNQIFEFDNQNGGYKVWPFDKRFHMLLNLAVGGDWGGANGIDDGAFPQKMLIDYVRVYKMIEK